MLTMPAGPRAHPCACTGISLDSHTVSHIDSYSQRFWGPCRARFSVQTPMGSGSLVPAGEAGRATVTACPLTCPSPTITPKGSQSAEGRLGQGGITLERICPQRCDFPALETRPGPTVWDDGTSAPVLRLLLMSHPCLLCQSFPAPTQS